MSVPKPPSGERGNFSRSRVVVSEQPPTSSQPASPMKHSDPEKKPPPAEEKTSLSAAAVNSAFGNTGEESPKQGTRRKSSFVAPTSKRGSDAVSMYSASQSILPVDPRDRLYYRPRRHLIQCYVDRKKNHKKNLVKTLSPGKNCIYSFHLEFTNEFVIACEPRPVLGRRTVADNSDGINGQQYTVEQGPGTTLFSINPADLEDPNAFVGKMSRRSKGLELVMFSEGNNATRKELAAIMMLPSEDGQRRFRVILPTIDPDTGFIRPVEGGEVKFLRDGRGTSIVGGSRAGLAEAMLEFSGDDDDNPGSMTRSQAPTFAALTEPQAEVHGTAKKLTMHCQLVREFLTNGEKSPNIIVLENRKPQWDSVLRGYQLNFHGRATEASEKNFQLVSPKDPEKVVMLFGKQKSDRYSVDFRYPLCGLQAAAIASALMEYKMITK